DRVEQQRQLLARRIAAEPGQVLLVARQPELAQPLLETRRDQLALPFVQRDTAFLVDERDDRSQVAIGQRGPRGHHRRRHGRSCGAQRSVPALAKMRSRSSRNFTRPLIFATPIMNSVSTLAPNSGVASISSATIVSTSDTASTITPIITFDAWLAISMTMM